MTWLTDATYPSGISVPFSPLLVVAHHAALAYHPYAPLPPKSLGEPMIWSAFPVVDSARWPGIELFVGFDDTFFMPLMFLISGVFAWASLERKGGIRFLRERAVKLGAGFVVSAAVLAPLAYYPTFL
jgi:Acyltransferase family